MTMHLGNGFTARCNSMNTFSWTAGAQGPEHGTGIPTAEHKKLEVLGYDWDAGTHFGTARGCVRDEGQRKGGNSAQLFCMH